MIKVTFTAKRNLLAGLSPERAVGDIVELTFSAQEPLTPSRRITRSVQTSLGGQRETIYNHALWAFEVTTEPVSGDTLDALIEFLTSVEDGTPFTFYPWEMPGGNPSPLSGRWVGTGLSCTLDSEGWSMTLVASNATGGSGDWYQISFAVVESP
jgi:hypothetical protein